MKRASTSRLRWMSDSGSGRSTLRECNAESLCSSWVQRSHLASRKPLYHPCYLWIDVVRGRENHATSEYIPTSSRSLVLRVTWQNPSSSDSNTICISSLFLSRSLLSGAHALIAMSILWARYSETQDEILICYSRATYRYYLVRW
jgi:hypothetical protein